MELSSKNSSLIQIVKIYNEFMNRNEQSEKA